MKMKAASPFGYNAMIRCISLVISVRLSSLLRSSSKQPIPPTLYLLSGVAELEGMIRTPGILAGLNDRSQSAYAAPAPKPVERAMGHARPAISQAYSEHVVAIHERVCCTNA